MKHQYLEMYSLYESTIYRDILFFSYCSAGNLTWRDGQINKNEIWIKIGGDHGGNSMKISLQILNQFP